MEREYEEYFEIDTRRIINNIWNNIIVIILVLVVFGLLGVVGSLYLMDMKYKSTTKVYITNKENTNQKTTAQELQVGNLILKDYKQIILSDLVLEEVIKKHPEWNLTTDALKAKLTITAPVDTRVLSITAEDSNKHRVVEIANEVREEAFKKLKEKISTVDEVTLLEKAKMPNSPSSPNTRKNAIISMFIGLLLSIAYFIMIEVMDDRIKKPEDIENLNIALLGIIPLRQERKGRK